MKNFEKTKICYDYQIFVRQRFGGISKVFYEICSRLESDSSFEVYYPVILSQNYYFKNKIPTSAILQKHNILNYLVRIINKVYFVCYLKRNKDCNIVHATYYSTYFYKWLPKSTKYVLTVHDCTQEIYSKKSLGNRRMLYLKKKAIRRADAIIVPTANTKCDVLNLYHVDENKVYIINWGQNSESKAKRIMKIPSQYILYVGMRHDYKNFDVLLQAMTELTVKYNNIWIVCVGGGKFSKAEKKKISNFGINKILQCNLDDEELIYAYQNALAFVYPSFYEGFGIPILEAFSNDCPVVLSNASCFPEIGGDAVLYFDPNDSKELSEKIEQIIEDKALREKMIQLGKQRVRNFTWDKTVYQVKQIYLDILRK